MEHSSIQSSGVSKASHNKRLRNQLTLMGKRLTDAKNDADLVALIGLLDQFPEPVQYDNTLLNRISLLIAALSVAVAALAFSQHLPSECLFIGAGILLITIIVYVVIRMKRKANLKDLTDAIYYRSVLFDYGLKDVPVRPAAKARELGHHFSCFRLGNHSREVQQILKGEFSGSEHTFDYQYFHYHYVNKRRETYTTTDSQGRTRVRTRTVYDHFDRYGFIVDFPYAKDIHISETALKLFSSGYKTSSVSFNKRFVVNTNSNMEAAKFLTPKILQEVEAAGAALGDLDLEFTGGGALCFSFTNNNTISANNRGSLSYPGAFAKEINGHNNQPALDAALEFIHTLLKYSDNNFEPSQRGK